MALTPWTAQRITFIKPTILMSKETKKTKSKAAPKAGETKKPVTKTAKQPAKKSAKLGKRYPAKQKAKVLAFVNAHNAKNGRGGAAAASRKFKISQITIGQWVKKAGAKPAASPASKKSAKRGRKPAVVKAVKGFAAKLRRLADVHDAITKMESELEALKSEYAKLKKNL